MPIDPSHLLSGEVEVAGGKHHQHALSALKDMNPLHFPVTFPEVFLRERAGFDVILGNPPWEKARVEEHGFWARFFPGLRGLNQRDRESQIERLRKERPDLVTELEAEVKEAQVVRQTLSRGPFPGMGTGDPDLYKAFCWRFWFLAAEDGGRIGVVLPRSVLAAKGSEEFRQKLFLEGKTVDATTLLNTGRWAFDMEPRYTVGLLAVERAASGKRGATVRLEGPYNSLAAYTSRPQHGGASFAGQEVLTWNDSASLPLLPTEESNQVFAQLRKAPRLDLDDGRGWKVRPLAEVHATNDKYLYDLASKNRPRGFWPVYKGASFDLWEPDTGEYYAWADPRVVTPVLQDKRWRGHNSENSVFRSCPTDWCKRPSTLPCRWPRIAFRDVTRATDSRTVRCALVPPEVFLNHKAPYFVFQRGGGMDEAYLLGVLSSLPLDWYARRFVEVSMTFFVLNPFPIPRPAPDDPLRLRVIQLAGRLACPDDRFADWARQVGVACGPLDPAEKQDMIHELDAVVARLFGLNMKQLGHIFETFHEGWDYRARLDATLGHFRRWEMKSSL